MSLSLSASPLLLVLCLFGAAALTYWTYRSTVPQLTVGRRVLLGGLRFLALFLVLFLLFGPIIRHLDRRERPPVLAVLVDDSQSLTVTGDSTSPETARRVFETLAGSTLGGVDGDVEVYRFSSDVRQIADSPESWPDSLKMEGQRTDLSKALDFVREDLKDANLRGILVVSDGQYNSGRNPLYVAERYPVPIYSAALGDTTSRRDLQIRGVLTNDIAYLGTEQPVRINLRAQDLPSQQVTVSLLRSGQVLGSASVTLPEGTSEIPVDLSYQPVEAGLQRLTVSVTHLSGEATHLNNDETVTVRVLDKKKRVLLIGAAPHPDLAAIRQVLEDNADTELTLLVQKASGSFYQESLPESLADFDAFVLAGYPGRSADAAFTRRIAEAGQNGTPLFFMLNQQTDLALLNQHFGSLLPVSVEAARDGFFEASFIPTAGGANHPILGVEGATADDWRRLPPLTYNDTRWRLNPGAEVLASTEVRGVALGDPMLAVLRRGRNRSAALLAVGAWRWKNVPEDLAALQDHWPQLLSNILQWITTREDDRPVRVQPVAELFTNDDPVRLTGQVYDESLNPGDRASVEIQVTAPDGSQYPYRMEPLGSGRYALDLGSLPAGTYTYTASAQQNGAALGADNGSFAVGSLNVEFRETRANTPLLRQIALRSGGSFFTPAELSTLPATLEASGSFRAEIHEEQRQTEVRNLYIFLAVIVVLLTTEWFLRKRSGLV